VTWVWQVNPGWLELFICSFILIIFFQTCHSTSSWFYKKYCVDRELGFIIYFYLLSMKLFWHHDLDHGFGWLIRVVFSCLFFNWFFLVNVIIQHWVNWELSFIICFNFFFFYAVILVLWLSFNRLTQVNSTYFFNWI
jgi:hypothetical protein